VQEEEREMEEGCWGFIGCRGEAAFWLESNGGEGGGQGDGFQWRSNGQRLGKALTGGSHLSVVKKK
jgi:hypothetical protein